MNLIHSYYFYAFKETIIHYFTLHFSLGQFPTSNLMLRASLSHKARGQSHISRLVSHFLSMFSFFCIRHFWKEGNKLNLERKLPFENKNKFKACLS